MGNTNAEYYARRRQEILEEINKYQGVIDELLTCKENIGGAKLVIEENVEDPITKPYDLSEENRWRGKQCTKASEMVGTISGSLADYIGSVENVMGQIDKAIDQVQEKIDELYEELAGLG